MEEEQNGFEDEYFVIVYHNHHLIIIQQLENIEVNLGDFVRSLELTNASFETLWNNSANFECTETYALSAIRNIPGIKRQILKINNSIKLDAVKSITESLGGVPLNDSDKVSDGKSHILVLSGLFLGKVEIVSRCRFVLTSNSGVAVEITCRSPDETISELVANAVA